MAKTTTAEAWNSDHPVGTAVRYWPILPPISSAPPIDTITRTPAWTLGNGVVVVSIAGKTGGVSLSHIEVLGMERDKFSKEGGG